MSTPNEVPTIGGFRRKTLITVGVVAAVIWAFAIQTKSVVLMSIVGGLTLVVLGLLGWAFLLMRRHKRLNTLLEGAMASPEARRDVLAKLDGGKDAHQIPIIFARAQLTAADDPARALEMLEAIELKTVPPQMQDDFAYLRAQLCLSFGRAQDARPLADSINVNSPQRKDSRGMLVAVVAETWARTGKAQDALDLLASVDLDAEKDELRFQLQVARVFAQFALGKTRVVKQELAAIGEPDVNRLGRFLAPRFKVNPDLQRLAREAAAEASAAKRPAAKERATALSGSRDAAGVDLLPRRGCRRVGPWIARS